MKYKSLLLLWFLLSGININAQNFTIEKLKAYAQSYLADSGNVGIAVGVITPQGIYKYSSGKTDINGNDTINSQTLFEIGSITKTFTGLLFTLFVQKGLMSSDDYIDTYLPKTIQIPESFKNKIKLWHLVTHTSGFPRLPSDFFQKTDFNSDNPYVNYDTTDLYNYLSTFTVYKAGKKASYSNLGMGLLGHILETCKHDSYENLIRKYICEPMNMHNTVITLRDSNDYKKMAKGYNSGKEVFNWDFDVFAGAGALKSNLEDMLLFLNENINPQSSDSMNSAIQKTHEKLIKFSHDNDIATCWLIRKFKHKRNIIWHDGGTGGFRSFIGFDPQTKSGVIVLSNSTNSVSSLGFSILKEICQIK